MSDDANQTGIEEVEDESEVSGDDELQKRGTVVFGS